MADLRINFAGIKSPNPFWLASAPPTNSGAQIHKAFEAGWGGAVWKTIGAPVLNVSNRYGAWGWGHQRMLAINNVELISDRPLEVNLREIVEVKRAWPDRAVIVSAMVESKPEAWHDIIRRIEDTGADGVELNYGCPHGMSERGMGAAVGQVPEYCEEITRWVMEAATIPVIVKLTPNVTNIVMPARAAVAAGANAISLINTVNSIVGVDLDTLEITPSIGGKGGHGGYAGPAVKPIALNMLAALGKDEIVSKSGLPISGMGGIATWQDAAQFLLLGASGLQVCTAAMHYGYRIVEDLCDGLSNWMDEKGFATIDDVVGRSLHRVSEFKDFDLSFRAVARISNEKCIRCNLCYVACNDTAHQCIDLIDRDGVVVAPYAYDVRSNGKQEAIATRPQPRVREEDCVGCRLCYNVCPVDNCIEMVELPSGRPPVTWNELTQKQAAVTEDWEAMEKYRQEAGIRIH
jgi:dihydropyrimidine dehydrogenase (NAD+) subunit PreA